MLTLFTIPKAFTGHVGIIQSNAIRSWTLLRPACEIVLCGDDPGTEEMAQQANAIYIPDIDRNEFGTPLLSSAFRRVNDTAKFDNLCFVNTDIILLSNFIEAISSVKLRKSMVIGQRWDLDVVEAWDYDAPNWEAKFRTLVKEDGVLHPPYGSDYFVFKKNCPLINIPPFAVGRPGWDCWFIYQARKRGYRVIDATDATTVIHQNHDYAHIPKANASTLAGIDWKNWKGPEIKRHQELVGGDDFYFTTADATHFLRSNGVTLALDYKHLRNRWYRMPILKPWCRPLFNLVDKVLSKTTQRNQESP